MFEIAQKCNRLQCCDAFIVNFEQSLHKSPKMFSTKAILKNIWQKNICAVILFK